jgi:hypothetical protein
VSSAHSGVVAAVISITASDFAALAIARGFRDLNLCEYPADHERVASAHIRVPWRTLCVTAVVEIFGLADGERVCPQAEGGTRGRQAKDPHCQFGTEDRATAAAGGPISRRP